jgi:hypothetical protein
MNNIDWEKKYKALLSRFRNAVDLAFQNGYQKGALDERLQGMMQQQQEMQEQLAQSQGMGDAEISPGSPLDGAREMNQQAGETRGGNDDLDAHLTELESVVAKSEGMSAKDLRKNLTAIKKKIQETRDVATLTKSLHKAGKLKDTQQNFKQTVNKPAPKVLTEQHRVIKDMIKSWDTSSSEAAESIEKIVKGND